MRAVQSIINFFEKRQRLSYLLVFIVAFSLFTYLQLDPTFADPDSFYHAKMALLLRDVGAITEFPWLTATTLKYNYIDHHFLYHLILIPFVSLYSPLLGLKIATILFASVSVVVFFWFLKQLRVRGAFWYALFLLTINPFIFRLNLAKAQALVLILLFFGLYFLFHRYYLALLLTSCLYVWLYGGWPLILVVTVIYLLVNWLISRKEKGKLRSKTVIQSLGLFFSVVIGVLAGLFFSPYFAKNFYFYWQQSFKIAVINYQSLIGVGGEWYPYLLPDLVLSAIPFFVLFIVAIVLFVYHFKHQTVNSWLFLIFSVLFFILTLKSRRNVEYFIPFALCFSALVITRILELSNRVLSQPKIKRLLVLSPLVILILISPVFYYDLGAIKTSFQNGFSWTKFSEPTRWLREHTEFGSIVFHSDWDEFPLLFYHNIWNYYIVGLDPTFMYEYDQDLHRYWVDITTGKEKENLYPVIKSIFGASYVFVDINQNTDFDQNLANNFNFEEVFENEEARIYQVK
ncbi:MAG: hypothetical protein A3J62_02970 [Candidatus Buchananbacteria bacterium RIFCSPHIGHO2_02_FULL_38_8]|uniref:Glycosyltransferase RgtA/B/C/D-like domain-containing protein n=1 Tax=Candidatus Buchananbacteria bacterium RIFCSPHIGHO2_02_FULL_38_8 TaxID=1797538 RepID=A0A1G1Y6I3_9BACT|nr:MAG: hypothetical protein A3J62_02970 [Candidatus Buchananbacteria bacterium RIFCSPHIGHO2_02_FULL_38_8]